MRHFLSVCFISTALLCFYSCSTPEPSNPLTSKIDSLFISWNEPGHPGGSIGIMKDDEVIYAKGFGLANLTHNIKNTDATLYNIASVSKEFTAFAMVLLEDRGLLSIDDDIRKYLTEIPDFGHTITIRHLLNHTSGLRSLHALMAMAGWRGDDRKDNDDLMRFMVNQRDLNFVPGAEYLYCNTGYIFMAEIVERVTGESFVPWMKSNVFEPTGMENTYVEEDINQVVPGNADSYFWDNDEERYKYSIPYWGYSGSGNVHTNVYDLLDWIAYLNDPGNRSIRDRMLTRGILNSGDTISYALGFTVREYKGEWGFGHGGAIGGYRAQLVSYPDRDVHFVILSNFSNSGLGGKVRAISDILMGKEPDPDAQPPDRDEEEPDPITPPEEIAGSYFSPELETTYRITIEDDGMQGWHQRHGFFEMNMYKPDTITSNLFAFRNAYVIRNDANQIEGLRITNGRVRNLWFEKIE